MQAEIFRWNRDPAALAEYDGYIIPGGFSYQDRVRAGAVAAKKPIVRTLMREAEQGKPIMGICNGAQILVESGMIPGIEWGKVQMALAPNIMEGRSGYYCQWVYVRQVCTPRRCAMTYAMREDEIIPVPIAHGEGRFITREHRLLEKLIKNDQIVIRYCRDDGNFDEHFPYNPNGSIYNIAGLCNPEGNVFALMPHPERATWVRQLPDDIAPQFSTLKLRALNRLDDMRALAPASKFFISLREYIKACRGKANARS